MKNTSLPSSLEIDAVIALARRVGAEILALRPSVTGGAKAKADGSMVTEADKKASDLLVAGLRAITPHISIVSEEDDEAVSLSTVGRSSTYWIVDPLDGTQTYIDGHDGFGVHIGLIDKGVPAVGVIFFPAEGKLYYTRDGKAYVEEGGAPPRLLSVTAPQANEETVRLSVPWRKNSRPQGGAYKMTPAVGGGRLCRAAEGAVDLALIERPFSYWDVAAAHAVLRAAGGELCESGSGQPVRYPSDRLYIPACIGGHPARVAAHLSVLTKAIADIHLQKNQPPPKLS